MTKHFCDRCKEDTTSEKVLLVVTSSCEAGESARAKFVDHPEAGIYDRVQSRFVRDTITELCSRCRGELHEFMKGRS